ncbi:preprotein translocase subunit SecE [Paraclostridium bifermentans]|uniref:preprotein translocase subunit SecE n=1 Tax=Paraclostridium bifermentans TaxID=1490 RepID=UPI00242D7A1A|nr:preprotein translocase subunit SecE [Paraclostridium bifermentans]
MAAQINESPRIKKKFSFVRYVKEIKSELKKVTWPTKKELLKNTGIVLTVVVSATILVWALDSVLSGALNLILK